MIFFQFKIVRTPYYVSVFKNLKREKKIVHFIHMYIRFLMEQSGLCPHFPRACLLTQ